jgi:hypothetical protein
MDLYMTKVALFYAHGGSIAKYYPADSGMMSAATYQESPQLAKLVEEGRLPSVENRSAR